MLRRPKNSAPKAESSIPNATAKPNIISFLIADSIIQEKGTNKWSVIGIFDRIHASSFPFIHPNLALYIKLSDAEGDYSIKIEFTNDAGQKLGVFEGLKLTIHSKLETPDFGIQTRNLTIPSPGKYNFDLYFNDQYCESVPLIIQETKSG